MAFKAIINFVAGDKFTRVSDKISADMVNFGVTLCNGKVLNVLVGFTAADPMGVQVEPGKSIHVHVCFKAHSISRL